MLEGERGVGAAPGGVPVPRRQAAVHRAEGHEDEHEDDVGAQAADQVDERQHPHPEQEEGERGQEDRVGEARGRVGRGVGAKRVVARRQRRPEGEPEPSVRGEDDEGEGVAKHEFEQASREHEQAAEEVVGAAILISRKKGGVRMVLDLGVVEGIFKGERSKKCRRETR